MIAWLSPGQDGFSPELTLRGPLAALVHHETGVDVRDPAARRRAGTWDTAVLQPLLAAVCVEAAVVAAGGDPAEMDVDRPVEPLPDVVAGASLGALVAWALATGQTPRTLLAVAGARGRAMAACARRTPGGMVAVADVDLDDALARGAAVGVLVPAVRNEPGRWLLSGEARALAAVGPAGRPVPVVGPWHSPLMTDALEAFSAALAELPLAPLRCAWVAEAPVSDDAAGRAWLVDQLTQPARWWDSMGALRALGVHKARILGPARVLRAQLRTLGGIDVEEG